VSQTCHDGSGAGNSGKSSEDEAYCDSERLSQPETAVTQQQGTKAAHQRATSSANQIWMMRREEDTGCRGATLRGEWEDEAISQRSEAESAATQVAQVVQSQGVWYRTCGPLIGL
jgi:hypothetical protein